MYRYIYDPDTKKKHATFSKKGQAILKRYLKKIIKFGGAVAGAAEQMFNPDDLPGNNVIMGRADVRGEDVEGKRLMRMAPMREEVTTDVAAVGDSRRIAEEVGREVTGVEITGRTTIQDMEGHTIKWQQMIYQITNRAKILLSRNPLLKIHEGFEQDDTGIWSGETPSAIDLEIMPKLEDDDEEDEVSADELYKTRLANTGYSDEQQDNMELISTTTKTDDEDGSVCFGAINKHSFLNPRESRHITRSADADKVYVIKVGLPGHFTIALYYPALNIVEFFDSGGAYDTSTTDLDGAIHSGTTSRLSTLRPREEREGVEARVKLTDGETGRGTWCLTENIEHLCVCESFARLFPGCEFVNVSTKNLQRSGKDAHCQTWVWLFIYLKFIWLPEQGGAERGSYASSAEVIEYLHRKKGEDALYNLIDNFWNYIIYYRPSNEAVDI